MKKIKAILFDIGNVILYFDNHRVSKRLLPYSKLSEPELFKWVLDLYSNMELDLGKTSCEDFLKMIGKKIQGRLNLTELKWVFSDIFEENKKIIHLLHLLKGRIPLIAVSNTNACHFEFIKQNFPVLNLMDKLVLSFELGLKKPHPGIYLEALSHARALPQECLLIDDQEKNVIPARLLGFKTHLYRGYEEVMLELNRLKVL